MKNSFIILFLVSLIFLSCKEEKKGSPSLLNSEKNAATKVTKRVGMVTGIKEDKIEYYKKLHAKVWPAVLKKIKDCNIQNYSIYLKKIGNEYYLFSYFEYTGSDYDMDMKKMAADRTTQQWWKLTDSTQKPLPEAAEKKQIWTNMEEVFHTN
ncbi:L-rhamnose mutarotase [Flavobacterium cutihirudinis]|uniref:L-rhamnose mutarotase n=1 Tax=Flavobacterium cutihirudinis TaxID=1265740 RepID=A0A3D9FTG2_9FLAO|nr:L-rhamnose mutarotase [Flavobacterium cutihirudinis]RED23858.1 L-rhamnose mutarotase [Flavobacterium cutihirudinis]